MKLAFQKSLSLLIVASCVSGTLACLERPRPRDGRILECESRFPPDASEESLAEFFGPENLTGAEIGLGEGFFEQGTVLFQHSPEDRVEILWKDKERRRNPSRIRVTGQLSHWKTASGLKLGLDLRTIERINRKPFRLMGFAWDYQGTVVSWSDGTLALATEQACVVRVRLAPRLAREDPIWTRWYRQVGGEREFSSGHPAMQFLNPTVYEIWLAY